MSFATYLVVLLAIEPAPGGDPAERRSDQEARPQVAIVTMTRCCATEAWPAAERRVEAELRILGLSVVHLPGVATEERPRRLELEQAARTTRSVAALRLVRYDQASGGQVEIWLSDRLTRKLSLRTVRLQGQGPAAAAVVALRVVELLRASLMEIHAPETAARPRLRVPAAVARIVAPIPTRRREPVWALRVGLGVLGSVEGVGPLGTVQLALRWTPRRHLVLELTVDGSPVGRDVREPALGLTARVGCASAKVWALYAPRVRGRLRPALGLGIGGLGFWTRGSETLRYQAQAVEAFTADLGATVQLGIVLGRQVWLRPLLLTGLTLPKLVVRLGEARAASFGAPYLAGLLGLELHWP